MYLATLKRFSHPTKFNATYLFLLCQYYIYVILQSTFMTILLLTAPLVAVSVEMTLAMGTTSILEYELNSNRKRGNTSGLPRL